MPCGNQMMKRVMIIGQPGAGKSTLARKMGDVTGLPVVHIDHIHWQSGWIERSRVEKTRLCRDIHSSDRWIFEGGHSSTWDERLDRCDTLIWLDVHIGTRMRRIVARTIGYFGRPRPDLPEGCDERFDRDFLLWVWETRHSGRRKMEKFFNAAPAGKNAHRLSTLGEVNRYLAALARD